jgi:hypothetical protein
MVRALFDTNVLIDHLNGAEPARAELARYRERAISIITWMEVMVGAPEPARAATRAFLETFALVPLDSRVADQAVDLRREHRIKLPDAVVWASARVHGMILVTRNTRDFPKDDPGVRAPYFL